MKKFIILLVIIIGNYSNSFTTNVSGEQGGYPNQWTLANSPYYVTDLIYISYGTLEIESGVVIYFDLITQSRSTFTVYEGATLYINPGVTFDFELYWRLIIYGNLNAVGTAYTPPNVPDIRFEQTPPSYNRWNGIQIDYSSTTGTTDLEYCGIEGVTWYPALSCSNVVANSGSSVTINGNYIFHNYCSMSGRAAGIYCYNCAENITTITNNLITLNTTSIGSSRNSGGIKCYHYSSPIIFNNTITFNSGFAGGGISCEDNSSPHISYNTITYNSAAHSGGGIHISNNEILLGNCSPNIEYNTITYNNCKLCGGGINVAYNSSPIIYNNVISNNFTDNSALPMGNPLLRGGGGIAVVQNSVTNVHVVINLNTITNNNSLFYHSNSYNMDFGNGGGIYVESPDYIVDIKYNIINGNTADVQGGGIFINNTPNLTQIHNNTSIMANNSQQGGGICAINSNLQVFDNPIIFANYINGTSHLNGYGGGIYCYNTPLSLTNNTIQNNTAISDGGGIYYTTDILLSLPLSNDIELNKILMNFSQQGNGGGLCINSSSTTSTTFNIVNNLFAQCTGVNGGGLFLNTFYNSINTINNNTIADNTASYDGGGIFSTTIPNLYAANDILWGNTPNSANILISDPPSNDYPNFVYSDIQGYGGNYYTFPNFIKPYDPQFNTNVIPFDYRLHGQVDPYHWPPWWQASPCIDAGSNPIILPYSTVDLDGVPRPSYGGISNTLDMGAYENLDGINPLVNFLSINKQVNNNNDDVSMTIYPNPFNFATNINFTLSGTDNVKIEIYDIQGKSVNTLTDKTYTNGEYNIKWEKGNIAKGVYLCKMTINNKTKYEKLIVE